MGGGGEAEGVDPGHRLVSSDCTWPHASCVSLQFLDPLALILFAYKLPIVLLFISEGCCKDKMS